MTASTVIADDPNMSKTVVGSGFIAKPVFSINTNPTKFHQNDSWTLSNMQFDVLGDVLTNKSVTVQLVYTPLSKIFKL